MWKWTFILWVPLACSSCATRPEYYLLPGDSPAARAPNPAPPVIVPVSPPVVVPDYAPVPSHYYIPPPVSAPVVTATPAPEPKEKPATKPDKRQHSPRYAHEHYRIERVISNPTRPAPATNTNKVQSVKPVKHKTK